MCVCVCVCVFVRAHVREHVDPSALLSYCACPTSEPGLPTTPHHGSAQGRIPLPQQDTKVTTISLHTRTSQNKSGRPCCAYSWGKLPSGLPDARLGRPAYTLCRAWCSVVAVTRLVLPPSANQCPPVICVSRTLPVSSPHSFTKPHDLGMKVIK